MLIMIPGSRRFKFMLIVLVGILILRHKGMILELVRIYLSHPHPSTIPSSSPMTLPSLSTSKLQGS